MFGFEKSKMDICLEGMCLNNILWEKSVTTGIESLKFNMNGKSKRKFLSCCAVHVQGNTHNDYLRYGKHIIHEGYCKYNTRKAIHYA